MLPRFDRTIKALSDTIAKERASRDCPESLGRDAAAFLLSVHRHMPDYLRPPFHILVLLFDAWPLPRRGRLFHRLSPADRLTELAAWRSSRLEFQRRFVEFYASLALFSIYSDLYGQDYRHGEPAPRERTPA